MTTGGNINEQVAVRIYPLESSLRRALHRRDIGLDQTCVATKNDLAEGFTKRYGIHTLVWYEPHETMDSAIVREKTLKEWQRQWKIDLIEKMNSNWEDLYQGLL